MSFSLPQLSYSYGALSDAIDSQTMEIHHSKHHAGYVKKLNAALEGHEDLLNMDIADLLMSLEEKVPADKQTAVRNNGGGHVNHTLFWNVLTPGGSSVPTGDLESEISRKFGSLEDFKDKLLSTTASQFGSGWGWLVVNSAGELEVYSTPNQDSPYLQGHTPILGIDVWEHAYYLKYQNLRPDYLENVWEILNWDVIAENYSKATL